MMLLVGAVVSVFVKHGFLPTACTTQFESQSDIIPKKFLKVIMVIHDHLVIIQKRRKGNESMTGNYLFIVLVCYLMM